MPRYAFLAAATAVAAFVFSGVSACLETGGQRRETLRARVHEIVPGSAHIRALGYGDCVELAPSPSCARAVFELPARDSARRAQLVRAQAETHGWTVTHEDNAEGGWSLFLKRPGYTAFVVLWRSNLYVKNCHVRRPPDECFNTVNLQRES